MSRRSILYIALASLIAATAPVLADEGQTYVGQTTATSPWFTRVGGFPPGAHYFYQAQPFEIPVATTCYIYGQQEYDGYLDLYQGTFFPLNPTSNLFASNDDGDLFLETSQLQALNLNPGPYTLVNSSYSPGSFGTFSSTIHCDGAVQPLGVPCNGWTISPGLDEFGVCLNNRFIVWIDGVSGSPTGGYATPVRLGSNDTGIFWFYSPTNFEVMVKVLDACGTSFNTWWVFAAALTNQSYNIQVFDTHTAVTRSYSNTFPTSSPATTDTSAFACP